MVRIDNVTAIGVYKMSLAIVAFGTVAGFVAVFLSLVAGVTSLGWLFMTFMVVGTIVGLMTAVRIFLVSSIGSSEAMS